MSCLVDWTTIPQSTSGSSQTSYKGYFDIGTIRIQYVTAQRTGLNTGTSAFNAWAVDFPASFANTYYSVCCTLNSDTGGVSSGEFKVTARTTANVTVNYNHEQSIGQSSVYYTVIAIGLKP